MHYQLNLLIVAVDVCVAELSLDSKNCSADRSNVIFVHTCSHNLQSCMGIQQQPDCMDRRL